MGLIITVRNTLLVFLISGLWHGAQWHFIVWGLIHALAFLPSLIFTSQTSSFKTSAASRYFQILLTFSFVSLAWIFFRANSVPAAIDYITHTFSDLYLHPEQILKLPNNIAAFLFMIPLIAGDLILKKNNNYRLFNFKHPIVNYVAYLLLSILVLFGLFNGEASDVFIYFQF